MKAHFGFNRLLVIVCAALIAFAGCKTITTTTTNPDGTVTVTKTTVLDQQALEQGIDIAKALYDKYKQQSEGRSTSNGNINADTLRGYINSFAELIKDVPGSNFDAAREQLEQLRAQLEALEAKKAKAATQ